MNPTNPPSRFRVQAAWRTSTPARTGRRCGIRLTEFQPGLFLADDGETLDLRGPPARWRGVRLNPVTGGPRGAQWALLAVAGAHRRRMARDGVRRLVGADAVASADILEPATPGAAAAAAVPPPPSPL